jgi:periplasmic nitrate reductase NapE
MQNSNPDIANVRDSSAPVRRKRELLIFFFLLFGLMPALAVAVVGGYGFCVWMYQIIAGPPTG